MGLPATHDDAARSEGNHLMSGFRSTARGLTSLAVLAAAALGAAAQAQPMPQGWLCCNMYAERDWVSDIGYRDGENRLVPAGTPARVTGWGRYRMTVELGNERLRFGNDYSRTLGNEQFAARLIVSEDPTLKLASWPPEIQKAVREARLLVGMTKEQVLMAVGYPVTSENPSLDARFWRYWIATNDEYQVIWDDQGRVTAIDTNSPLVRRRVLGQ